MNVPRRMLMLEWRCPRCREVVARGPLGEPCPEHQHVCGELNAPAGTLATMEIWLDQEDGLRMGTLEQDDIPEVGSTVTFDGHEWTVVNRKMMPIRPNHPPQPLCVLRKILPPPTPSAAEHGAAVATAIDDTEHSVPTRRRGHG